MKRSPLLIVLVFWLMVFSFFCYAEEIPGKKNQTISAESIDQLIRFILSALADNDIQRLEQIITTNSLLIRENNLLNIQICGTLLDAAVEKELAGQGELGNNYFKITGLVAEIYKNAANSNYLLDKVDIFQKWSKEEKGTYQKGEEL